MAGGDKSAKTELLDVLAEVKTRVQDKLGIVDFPMPQFILIGSQSVGKSRLVESFAGEQFNFCSGTLGSRRPTVLEFRHVDTATTSKWFILNKDTNQWNHQPMDKVLSIISEAHNSLGASVSADPVNIRVESADCVDMQIVDLPGFRGFAGNDGAKGLADQIVTLNTGFMQDPRNVMLCVEEAGDAANLSSLRRCMDFDPQLKRTILIRNKLDKYYDDLTSDNVNKWLEGFGDLPKNLLKFSITLPHWSDGQPPPKSLAVLRNEMDQADVSKLAALGTSKKFMDTVGFSHFARYMEKRIERMFVEAISPVTTKLKELEATMVQKEADLKTEMEDTDPNTILSTVRTCGCSFAGCLSHVMEGFIRSDVNRMTLDDELREFHSFHKALGDEDKYLTLPSDDFGCLEDYIEYLKSHIKVPSFEVAINGGAQFRRLMFEVETFLRFSEIGCETKKRDVLQSFGISMGSLTWREVVVKLLNHDAHLPLKKRVQYTGERIKWFFVMQKRPIIDFMLKVKGSPDEKLYSVLYTKHAKLIEENQTIKKLVFETYDAVVDRQLAQFTDLFKNTLSATFSNPWVFLKKTSAKLDDEGLEGLLPSLDDTKLRVPDEIQNRAGTERLVTKWLYDIPIEPHKVDEAVDQVQLLVLKVYSIIRSQVCDQVELFAESFFKLPLLRRLEEDMSKIELDEIDRETYRLRREKLDGEFASNSTAVKEVRACIKTLTDFSLKSYSLS